MLFLLRKMKLLFLYQCKNDKHLSERTPRICLNQFLLTCECARDILRAPCRYATGVVSAQSGSDQLRETTYPLKKGQKICRNEEKKLIVIFELASFTTVEAS